MLFRCKRQGCYSSKIKYEIKGLSSFEVTNACYGIAEILGLWVMIKMSSRLDHWSGGENVAVSVERAGLLDLFDSFLVVLSVPKEGPIPDHSFYDLENSPPPGVG
jgi:hypothetical protein